jgi:hypothetical protein
MAHKWFTLGTIADDSWQCVCGEETELAKPGPRDEIERAGDEDGDESPDGKSTNSEGAELPPPRPHVVLDDRETDRL